MQRTLSGEPPAPTAQQRSLLWAISESGALSRTDLAVATGMSKAAVTGVSRELLEQGLVIETETTARGAGRPSILLALNARAAWFAGVSLRPDRGRLLVCNAAGDVAGDLELPPLLDPEAIATELDSALDRLLEETGVARADLRGLGIAISGVVNSAQDTCIRSTLMGWENVPLGRIVSRRLGLPVHVENDANAMAMREKLFGAATDAKSFALAAIGDGIGGALFIERTLFRGHSGGAGELAHVTVEPGGAPCSCGKRGCLDTVASMRAIRAAAQRLALGDDDLDALERAAAQGTTAAVEILHRAGEALGLALAHVIQIVNPEKVLVRVPSVRLDGLFCAAMRQSLDSNVLPQMRSRTAVDIAATPSGANAAGAASIAAHRFLLAPTSKERTTA